jgi:hypothetical protein
MGDAEFVRDIVLAMTLGWMSIPMQKGCAEFVRGFLPHTFLSGRISASLKAEKRRPCDPSRMDMSIPTRKEHAEFVRGFLPDTFLSGHINAHSKAQKRSPFRPSPPPPFESGISIPIRE